MLRRTGIGLVCALVAMAGCSGTAGRTVTGDHPGDAVKVTSCGQELAFSQPPERVVTLDQSSTETLLALRLTDRLIGTSNLKTKVAPEYQDAYDKVPVLSTETLTGEQLREAAPDLVVSSFLALYTRDRVGTREELRQLGLPTYVSAVECPDENDASDGPFGLLFQDYENLGRVFGVEDRAARLVAGQRAVIRSATRFGEQVTGSPSIVWLYSTFNGIPYVAGHGGMPSQMSRLVGARNAFDDVPQQWPEVSWEEIANRDPDIIVVGDLSERGASGDTAAEKVAMMKSDPTLSKLTAVRENRLIEVPGIEMDPSVRTVHALQLLVDGMKDLGYAG